VRIKQRSEEWVNSEVLDCIKDRDKAFYLFKKEKSEENLNNFRVMRNKARSAIHNAKKNFLCSSVENNQNNS